MSEATFYTSFGSLNVKWPWRNTGKATEREKTHHILLMEYFKANAGYISFFDLFLRLVV